RRKFDPKSIKLVMVSYAEKDGMKGYQLLDRETGKIYSGSTRDTIFDEATHVRKAFPQLSDNSLVNRLQGMVADLPNTSSAGTETDQRDLLEPRGGFRRAGEQLMDDDGSVRLSGGYLGDGGIETPHRSGPTPQAPSTPTKAKKCANLPARKKSVRFQSHPAFFGKDSDSVSWMQLDGEYINVVLDDVPDAFLDVVEQELQKMKKYNLQEAGRIRDG
ncbi:hypothetical protein HDU93_009654, partial [Gonapodya sp. JEL0774]